MLRTIVLPLLLTISLLRLLLSSLPPFFHKYSPLCFSLFLFSHMFRFFFSKIYYLTILHVSPRSPPPLHMCPSQVFFKNIPHLLLWTVKPFTLSAPHLKKSSKLVSRYCTGKRHVYVFIAERNVRGSRPWMLLWVHCYEACWSKLKAKTQGWCVKKFKKLCV